MFSNFMQAFGAMPGMPRSKNNYQDKGSGSGTGFNVNGPGGFSFGMNRGPSAGAMRPSMDFNMGNMQRQSPMMPSFLPYSPNQVQSSPMQSGMGEMGGNFGDMYRQGKIQTMGGFGGGGFGSGPMGGNPLAMSMQRGPLMNYFGSMQ